MDLQLEWVGIYFNRGIQLRQAALLTTIVLLVKLYTEMENIFTRPAQSLSFCIGLIMLSILQTMIQAMHLVGENTSIRGLLNDLFKSRW